MPNNFLIVPALEELKLDVMFTSAKIFLLKIIGILTIYRSLDKTTEAPNSCQKMLNMTNRAVTCANYIVSCVGCHWTLKMN